jgi:hypothetical protein
MKLVKVPIGVKLVRTKSTKAKGQSLPSMFHRTNVDGYQQQAESRLDLLRVQGTSHGNPYRLS